MNKGFTLIELLIVIAILSIIAAVAVGGGCSGPGIYGVDWDKQSKGQIAYVTYKNDEGNKRQYTLDCRDDDTTYGLPFGAFFEHDCDLTTVVRGNFEQEWDNPYDEYQTQQAWKLRGERND